MAIMHVIPKSDKAVFRRKLTYKRPENNLRKVETRIKAGRGDTYRLLTIQKCKRAMLD